MKLMISESALQSPETLSVAQGSYRPARCRDLACFVFVSKGVKNVQPVQGLFHVSTSSTLLGTLYDVSPCNRCIKGGDLAIVYREGRGLVRPCNSYISTVHPAGLMVNFV